MFRTLCAVLVGSLLFGCHLQPLPLSGPEAQHLPQPQRTGYAIHLVYTSTLPDPYYVLSGPDESYARYSVAAAFEALLRSQVARLSDPAGARAATLKVHLMELTTRFRRIGGSPLPSHARRYALLDTAALRLPAPRPVASRFGFLDREEPDPDIPEEVRKGATLVAIVELAGDGVDALQQTITANFDDRITREDYDPRDAYQYADVLDATLRQAAEHITELVQTHLR